jgi:type II secretory ATPase GspE/PulE/Tfp pilus assembly ATPase PilB-like protein
VNNTETEQSVNPDKMNTTPRIGELLVREGFIKEADVQMALSIQQQEKEWSDSPLGEILVKMGYLSQADLERILKHPDLRLHIGNLAVKKGMLTREQLDACLQKQGPGELLGEVFVREGLLTRYGLEELLKEQLNSRRIGDLAVKIGLVEQQDLDRALGVQVSPRTLGAILCGEGLVNSLDLYYVLNKYKKQLRLGEILIKLKYIDKSNLNQALREQRHSSESVGDILLRKKMITLEQLQEALSRQSNIPFRTLKKFVYSEDDKRKLSRIISQKYAEKNLIIPLSLVGRDLTLALVNPDNIHIARELKALYTNLNILCVLITEQKFTELFEVLYSRRLAGKRAKEEPEENAAPEGMDFMQIELDENMEGADDEGPVYDAQDIEAEEIVNFIIKYGISNRASDIHLEQDREGVKLRYRIDGVLQDMNLAWLKKKLQEKAGSIISRIKIISNLDIAEKRLPQDGVFRINYFDKAKGSKYDLDFRIATCRAITGENVVIRILDSRNAAVSLESLNHSHHVLQPIKSALKSSAGMILVTGPTGSGKSSTLYGALKFIYDPSIKIITAEDPIEYSFPGIMQTQVHPKIDLNFSRLLRSFLRLDPDVIFVGEIRDKETARISFDAAQTGHLVLSTLHTNDSVSSVPRLLDLGVERSQVASSLSCALAQRLVRRICPVCAEEYMPEEVEWSIVFDQYPSHLRFYKGRGCEACGFTGYKGRTLISEVFEINKEIAAAMVKGAEVDEVKLLAQANGMKTLLDDGLLKLQETTLTELLRMVPHEMIQMFKMRNAQAEKETDLDTRNGRTSVRTPGGEAFVLVNPENDGAELNRLCSKYMAMLEGSENGEIKVDQSLFRSFILESFREISSNYHCDEVRFYLASRNGKIEISALPAS